MKPFLSKNSFVSSNLIFSSIEIISKLKGVILNLSSKVNGYVNITETTNREDFNETVVSGSLKLKF